MTDPFLFAGAVVAILSTPGPTNTLVATSGATVGIRRSLLLVPAEAAGYLVTVLLTGLLLRPLLTQFPAATNVLRTVVGTYLVLLAVGLWRRGQSVEFVGPLVKPKQVFITTLLNPKGLVFALGIIPFGADMLWLYVTAFSLLITAVSIGWIGIGATMGAAAARRGGRSLVPRLGAAVIAAFAAILIVGPYVMMATH